MKKSKCTSSRRSQASQSNSCLVSILTFILIIGSIPKVTAEAKFTKPTSPTFKEIHSLSVPSLRKIEKTLIKDLNKKSSDQTKTSYQLAMLYSEIFRKKSTDKYLVRQASHLAKQAIELDPKSQYGYIALSEVLLAMNLGPKALELLNQVKQVKLKDMNTVMLQELRIKAKNGKLTPGNLINFFKGYGKAIDSTGGSYETEVTRNLIQSVSTHDQALDLFDFLKNKKKLNSSIYAFGLSRFHASKKNFKAAKEALIGIDFNSLRIDDYVFLMELALIAPSSPENPVPSKNRLMAFLDQFRNSNPNDEGLEKRELIGRLFYSIAIASTKFRGYKLTDNQVLSSFKKATLYNNDPVQSIKRLASLSPFLHQQITTKYFDWVAIHYPGSAKVYAAMAEVWQNQLSNYDAAIKGYLDAIVFEPKQSDHFIGLGIAYYSKMDFQKAKTVFTTALKINPSDALAAYNLACMHAITGEQEAALVQLGVAFQLDPSLTKSAEEDPDLKSLRSNLRFQNLIQLTH